MPAAKTEQNVTQTTDCVLLAFGEKNEMGLEIAKGHRFPLKGGLNCRRNSLQELESQMGISRTCFRSRQLGDHMGWG